jgi:hypothetical protein
MPSAGPHAPFALQSTGGGGHSVVHSHAGPAGLAFGVGSQTSFPTDPSAHFTAYAGIGPQSHVGGGGGGHGLIVQPHFSGGGYGPGAGGTEGSFAGGVDGSPGFAPPAVPPPEPPPAHGGPGSGIGPHTGVLTLPSQHFTAVIGSGPQSHAGGGGHFLISQWQTGSAFDLMQRPVLPPSEPSGQISVGIPSSGPQSPLPQSTTRSDADWSVPSDAPSLVRLEQAKMVAPNAAKKQNVRIFIVRSLRRHHAMEGGPRADHEIV